MWCSIMSSITSRRRRSSHAPNDDLSGSARIDILVDLLDLCLNIAGEGLEAPVPQIIAHFIAQKNRRKYKYLKGWSEWQDSNLRPLRPERSALPG